MESRTLRRRLLHTLMLATLPTALASGTSGAEPANSVPVAYAKIDEASTDGLATGSLPSANFFSAHTLSGFSAFVNAGSIIVRESAPTRCLPDDLTQVVADVATRFGPLSVESTHRTLGRNRSAGGARHSLHLACRAIDFRIHVPTGKVMAYLRSRPEVGGLKVYRSGIIDIDNGERRSW
jgi:uncharacterized protein YcbK (DUF882 family)